MLLYTELDYPSGSAALCARPACLPGPCFGEQNRPSLGLVTPMAFLGTSSKGSDAAQFIVSVWQLVLEKNIDFVCVQRAVIGYSRFYPPPPPGKTACSLAKAHMAFLCFKCSSYYLDLKVYRVKETFMEQLRPVRT